MIIFTEKIVQLSRSDVTCYTTTQDQTSLVTPPHKIRRHSLHHHTRSDVTRYTATQDQTSLVTPPHKIRRHSLHHHTRSDVTRYTATQDQTSLVTPPHKIRRHSLHRHTWLLSKIVCSKRWHYNDGVPSILTYM
jgi:hypothetical protein